ncbi:hypothetical protein BH09ACT5_BH09ACT5_18160 [soil metagenome]
MRHREPGLLEAEPQPLPGDRVHVARRVPYEEDSALRRRCGPLPERAGALEPGDRREPREPTRERGGPGDGLLEVGARGPENGDAHEVRRERRHVHLGPRRPVDLDQVGPRFEREVPGDPEAAAGARHGALQSREPPHSRVQPVRAEEPRAPDAPRHDPAGILFERLDTGDDPLDAELGGSRQQRGVQRSPPHPPPLARAEQVVRPPRRAFVAHSAQGHPGRVHAEPREEGHGAGHEPLAARLVDGALTGLDHDGGEAGHPVLDRGGEPHRPAAHHDDVDVGSRRCTHTSSRRALFSVGMRNPSRSTAFSTVKASAVIHAVCTSGSATPSTATIT